MEELEAIMQKFAASGWDLIAVPAQEWLDGKPIRILWYQQSNRLIKNVGTVDVS